MLNALFKNRNDEQANGLTKQAAENGWGQQNGWAMKQNQKKQLHIVKWPLFLASALLLTSCTDLSSSKGKDASYKAAENIPDRKNDAHIRNNDSVTSVKDQDGVEKGNDLYPGTGNFLGHPGKRHQFAKITGEDLVLNFENADLTEVVAIILGNLLKVDYVLNPMISGKVSLKTTRPMKADDVLAILESILRMHGAAMMVEEGLYKIVPMDIALRGSYMPQIAEHGEDIPAGYSVRLIPLRYISVLQMEKMLEPFASPDTVFRVDVDRNILVLAAPGIELNRLLDTVDLFDVDWLKGKSVGLFRLGFVDADVLADELKTVFGNEAGGPLEGILNFVPISRLNALLVMTTQPEYLDKAARWIERFDKGNDAGQNIYVYYLQNGKAVDVANVLTNLFMNQGRRSQTQGRVAPGRTATTVRNTAGSAAQNKNKALAQARQARMPNKKPQTSSLRASQNMAGEQDIRIVADEMNNALLIRASESEYRMIKAALRKLDIVPLQVLIEATIAEVTLTDDLRFGLQWFFNTGSLGNGDSGTIRLASGDDGSLAPTFPGFAGVINNSSGGIRGVLDTLEGVTTVNVISSPHLMVLDNQTAELKVGTEVPVVTQQQQSTDANNSNLVNTVQFKDIGVILQVTPRISSDGTISMEIEQEVSNVVRSINSGELTPTISQKSVKSSIVSQSGETIVLGGLISDEETKTRNGLPLVSKIPVLGNLFSRTEVNKARTELLILISPKIIRNASEARRITEELRDRLQGIKEMENRLRGPAAQ